MAKGPIVIHSKGRGACHLVHYPPQDTLIAIDDTQRQEYNKALICKGVSDGGDEELVRSDNYKRLFPWYETSNTTQSLTSHLFRTRRMLNDLLGLNNTLMGVYDTQVAASQVAPPSTQKATASASSQSELIHRYSARNDSTIRLQSRGNSSPGRVEPPLAYDNLSTPGTTTSQSGQLRSAADSCSPQAHHKAGTGSYSNLLPLQNEGSYEYATDNNSDSPTESSADITDNNQLSPTPSTPHIISKAETPSPIRLKPSKSSRI
ncbi:hypothetical protein BHYA_0127g00050 [Botrytis hyacinthi]|uniref:Uncharacterized protein n=1 Tax=Botrytis hyacinthi TaxID=278943 RepID=A0A4Z1GLN8_9HELO|nr:hypothetical protein BHYA_0127g00050 [Botrytis hyacinthi]